MPEKTRAFLVVAAQDAAGAERTGAPCVRLCYRVGENGTLQRAQMSMTARGGLMGIYEAPGLAAGQPERIARDIQAECTRRGYGGVVLDLEPAAEALPNAERLCAALGRLGVRHFVPETLCSCAPEGKVIVPAAVSGGSFAQMLDALCTRYGAENLCLDLVRTCSDFTMPSYTPDGRPISPEELAQLQETYLAQSFYSPELCCKYFTYRSRAGGAHFVLFDDGDTAAAKLRAARERGVGYVFLLYSEWSREAKALLGG